MLFELMLSCSCVLLLLSGCCHATSEEEQKRSDDLTSMSVCYMYQREKCHEPGLCKDFDSDACWRCMDHCPVLLAGFGQFANAKVDEATSTSPSFMCRVTQCLTTPQCRDGEELQCWQCLQNCGDVMPPPIETYSSRQDCEIKKCFQTTRCDNEDDDPRPCQRCLDECRELTANDQTTPDDVSTPEIPYIPYIPYTAYFPYIPEDSSVRPEEQSTAEQQPVMEATTAPDIPYIIGTHVPHMPRADIVAVLENVTPLEQMTVQQEAVTPLPGRAVDDGSHGDEAPPADELDNVADNPVRICLFWCRWRGCARNKTCESCFKECDPQPVDSATSIPEQQPAERPMPLQLDEQEEGSGSAGDLGELIPVWMPDPLADRPEVEVKIPDPDPEFAPPVVDVPAPADSGAEPNSDVIVPGNVVYASDSEHGAQEPCLRHILSCAVECLSVCLKGSTRECVTCGMTCFIEMSFYRVEDRSAIRPSTSDSRGSKALSSSNCAVTCLKPCHRPTSDLCLLCATNCIGLIAAANSPTDSPGGGAGVESVGEERADVVESNVQAQQSNNFCVSYCEEFKDSETQFSKCKTDCCYWHPPCAS